MLRMLIPASPRAPASAPSWPARFGSLIVSSTAMSFLPDRFRRGDSRCRDLERDVAAARRYAPALDAFGPVLSAEHGEEVAHSVAALAPCIAGCLGVVSRAQEVAKAFHERVLLPGHGRSLLLGRRSHDHMGHEPTVPLETLSAPSGYRSGSALRSRLGARDGGSHRSCRRRTDLGGRARQSAASWRHRCRGPAAGDRAPASAKRNEPFRPAP